MITQRSEAFAPLRVIGLGAFLAALGFAVLPHGRSYTIAVVSLVIWTVGEMLIIPAAGGWVANRASVKHRGQYMGIYTMAWGLGFILGPAIGTWIYQHLGPDQLCISHRPEPEPRTR